MILLLVLLSFCVETAWSLEKDVFSFDGELRQFAVGDKYVYIATDEKLHQLSHDLKLIHSLNQRGISYSSDLEAKFIRLSESASGNATFLVNVLLPFPENKTLISCGMVELKCGFCEVLELQNISNLLHSEGFPLGPQKQITGASVSFLVEPETTSKHQYILTAIEQLENHKDDCVSDMETINIHNAQNEQSGGLFSISGDPKTAIKITENVKFVDGFQINSTIYLFSNVAPKGEPNKVLLSWLQKKTTKALVLQSLQNLTLRIPDGAGSCRLLSSSILHPAERVLWSGVFSVDGETDNTELLLFDISPDHNNKEEKDPDFYMKKPDPTINPKILKPIAVLFKQNNMTSVLAVRQRSWMVFFIGTGDGQLIKLVVDRNYRPACPKLLYRADTSDKSHRKVFPGMHLDPVDQKYIYIRFKNQIKREVVSMCSSYKTLQDCWSAQDPYCVWCGSKNNCTFKSDCKDTEWVSIPDEMQEKIVSHKLEMDSSGKIKLIVQIHVIGGEKALENFACNFSPPLKNMSYSARFPKCSYLISHEAYTTKDLDVSIRMRLGSTQLREKLKVMNCSEIYGLPSPVLCQRCINAGCGWSNNICSWANRGEQNVSFCKSLGADSEFSGPVITSIKPSTVSFYGRNHALLSGSNLRNVTAVRIQADMDCSPQESPVWNNTGVSLTFHIPSTSNEGKVNVCLILPDGNCYGNTTIIYKSSPFCSGITPSSTWMSGKRKIAIMGSYLEFVEGVTHSHNVEDVRIPINSSHQNLIYETGTAKNSHFFSSFVSLKVANKTLPCSQMTYYPDPMFTSFTSLSSGTDVLFNIQKKTDNLEITAEEVNFLGVHNEKIFACVNLAKDHHNDTFTCKIQNVGDIEFKELQIKYGDESFTLKKPQKDIFWPLLVLLLIPLIVVVLVIVFQKKQKKLTAQVNRFMENLEMDIRNDIRQGFVDLQTDKAELMENVGAIPFLDYKHFASKIFFPENEALKTLCMNDIGQDVMTVQLDESYQRLSQLLQNQRFLTSMIHSLEEQKSFTIRDKCALASLLTVALHGNLTYLTKVMKLLLKDLMEQNSNAQPKLLLRRTESVVEKLLTNWMSICLYGFLRETVGQHLYLLMSALTQHIAKGPVDSVTEKALYTLSEDWLLWQAPDFSSLKLKVLFEVGNDGGVSEALEVEALSCDTVEQLKVKILSAFKSKFGFAYSSALREVHAEYEKDGLFISLQEVDESSEVIGEVTMLNTLKHHKVTNGATIKVLSLKGHLPLTPQGSVKDEENFSRKYFHLIDPDVVEDQNKSLERKKLKVKEVHLTKLLSTKVAVHTFVENLFRSIWGISNARAPIPVKFFFDFLDTEADNMKIVDPDVRHIWKTNSLPLRFWVNILKNPQFVFDLEKTPHLDGCLSVIAQAFMDSFSLSEMQLGKHAPTNKLLYAKDIPKFKQEVKMYYKSIRDLAPVSDSDLEDFLKEESKKHENEFNEAAALREIYKFMQRYFTEIKQKLGENGSDAELAEQLQRVKESFDKLKSCSWN